MRFAIADYATCVFDCDGVILDSNRIKSDAFHRVCRRFGDAVAEQFVAYHQRHGGISRYRKFAYLLDEVLKVPQGGRDALLAELLEEYARLCLEGLLRCALIPGVAKFLHALPATTDAFVVTGGDQQEVCTVFAQRGLATHFRAVLGSPTSKRENMAQLQRQGVFGKPACYFGDAELDRALAAEFGLDFVFVSGASEWPGGLEICRENRIVDFRELA